MKAITLYQPWATLVAIGAKRFETRSWATGFRGPLVIHAGKSRDYLELTLQDPFNEVLRDAGYTTLASLPLGAALCVVDLQDVWPTHELMRFNLSEMERAFGDYSLGRYAWELRNVRPFDEPVPWRGAQGLWPWTGPLPEGVTR